MLSIKNWPMLTKTEQKECLARPTTVSSIKTKVMELINQVQINGDKALISLTKQLDGVILEQLQIPPTLIHNAQINQLEYRAINQAIATIKAYHQSLVPEQSSISTAPGVIINTQYRPIQRVGLYVPGGNKTPLVSSLLMQAIPALVAGCPIKVLCTPPGPTGEISPHLLVAARLCGIETIYPIGGAQAIAAMAYGTETVVKVDKIFGPGNSYVTEAKNNVASDPLGAAIDMPAGPSEVMILADTKANPSFIAADLLAQAEHGIDSQVLLICEDITTAQAVNQQVMQQLEQLSRQEIIKQSLANSTILIGANRQEQLEIINGYAPEHLIINRIDAESWIESITAVGTIFLGSWAAETLGDYVTGSNHVLPTNGFARNHNGLSTLDFLTRFSVQSVSQQGIKELGPVAVTLAQIEGLDAHARAVQIRLNALREV